LGRGKHQSSLDLIEAAKNILEEIQPASVRAVCYQLFIGCVIPNMSKNATDRVSKQLTWAREQSIIDWRCIVDETREAEAVAMWADPGSFVRGVKGAYRKDLWRDQAHEIEIWSEKGTVRGTLAPILEEYGVTLRVLHGYSSATVLHDVAEISRSRPIVALYVGDRDPSGMHMSEVDAPRRIEKYGGNVEILRIAILGGDSHLPSFPTESKQRDARYTWYRQRYGDRCWELDAMRPPDLRERVEKYIRGFIDWPTWERSMKAEEAEIASINDVLCRWEAAISRPAAK